MFLSRTVCVVVVIAAACASKSDHSVAGTAQPTAVAADASAALALPSNEVDGGGSAPAPASTPSPPDAGEARPRGEEPVPQPLKGTSMDRVAGGVHWRFRTKKGTVHVWRPPGYRTKTAGVLVYVHGHGSTADSAWSRFELAKQFRGSKQNALFVVPDSVHDRDDRLKYDSLAELLKEVHRHTRLQRPGGTVVVIGHSGAFRSILAWLDYRPLAHIILLDALFGGAEKFAAWLEKPGHKMTVVGEDTAEKAEAFLRGFKGVVRMKKIPEKWDDFTKVQRTARLLYLQSQYGHMQLVTNGKVIPLLLRRTPLRLLESYAPKQ